jgi:hypothetical protein
VASWRAHEGGVTCLEAVGDGSCLLSASADRTLALWDVRGAAPAGGHHPAPLARFVGHKVRAPCMRARLGRLICGWLAVRDCSCA